MALVSVRHQSAIVSSGIVSSISLMLFAFYNTSKSGSIKGSGARICLMASLVGRKFLFR